MEYKHSCINCKTEYTDNDYDDYLCKPCKDKKNAIASKIDASIANKPRKEVKTKMQQYDEARGNMPFPLSNFIGL